MSSQNPSTPSGPTEFTFEHKVFQVPGAHFAHMTNSEQPALFVRLGDLDAAIPLVSLSAEFGIASDSHDGKLLKLVERGLRYVREILPNDSIPTELIDGSASWTVNDQHRITAQRRLTMYIVTWLTGGSANYVDAQHLEQLAEDPATRKRSQEAFSRIAEHLGLPPENKEEVVNRIDVLARELAYIEALHERCEKVSAITDKLNESAKVYRRDQSILPDITRMLTLIEKPTRDLLSPFEKLHARLAKITLALEAYDEIVLQIRQLRDDIHYRLMDWDELLDSWEDIAIEPGMALEQILKDTYRFLAVRFTPNHVWRRSL